MLTPSRKSRWCQSGTYLYTVASLWERPWLQCMPYGKLRYTTELCRTWSIQLLAPPDQSLVNMVIKFSTTLNLIKEAIKNNLTWWTSLNRHTKMEFPLYPLVPNMIAEFDASNTGWGVWQGEIQIKTLNHINYLEMLYSSLPSSTVLCKAEAQHHYPPEDNVTAVTYINKLGEPIHRNFANKPCPYGAGVCNRI